MFRYIATVFRYIAIIFGATLAVGGVVLNGFTTFAAAAHAGVNFWQYAMLNKFGVAVMLWNYSPAAVMAAGAAVLMGSLVFIWGRQGLLG